MARGPAAAAVRTGVRAGLVAGCWAGWQLAGSRLVIRRQAGWWAGWWAYAGFNHRGLLAVPGSQCRHPGWCLPRPIAWPVPTGSPHAAQLPVKEDAAVTRMPCAPSQPQGGRHSIGAYLTPHASRTSCAACPSACPVVRCACRGCLTFPLRMTPAMLYCPCLLHRASCFMHLHVYDFAIGRD